MFFPGLGRLATGSKTAPHPRNIDENPAIAFSKLPPHPRNKDEIRLGPGRQRWENDAMSLCHHHCFGGEGSRQEEK